MAKIENKSEKRDRGKQLYIILSQQDYDKVKMLSKSLGMKKGQLVKASLKYFYQNINQLLTQELKLS